MKKLIVIIFSLICLDAAAQKAPTKTDTTKKDTAYAIILQRIEFEWLISKLRELDEKPSVINGWIQNIYKKTELLTPPLKDQPKK